MSNQQLEQSAEALCQEGLAHLVEFEALQDQPNPNKLKSAAKCLQQSLKLNAKLVQPYVGLAYISFLLNDLTLTQEYLKLAQAIDPEFPPLKALQAQVSEK